MSKNKRRWVGRIYLGRDQDGKQVFEWVGRYATRRERDDAVAARRTELRQGKTRRLPTCDEYVDRYPQEYERRHKHSSYVNQRQSLKRFRTDFAGGPLDVDRAEAKDWVNGEGRWQHKPPVPARSIPAVIKLYNHAIDEDDLPLERNPFRKLAATTKGRAEQAPPTEAELNAYWIPAARCGTTPR